MKKVLSVFLALVMALSVVSISALAAKVEPDFVMQIGETRTVYLPGATYEHYSIVKFTAPGDGLIAISSKSLQDVKSDLFIELYDETMTTLLAEEDSEDSTDFYLEFECEGGKTYCFAMGDYYNATQWEVTIECFHIAYVEGVCTTCGAECDHTPGYNFVGVCPCGQEYGGVEIKDGDEIKITSGNEYSWFKFVPTETAAYLLTSDCTVEPETEDGATDTENEATDTETTNTENEATDTESEVTDTEKEPADPACDVLDETGDGFLAYHDDINASDYNFALAYRFVAGETYYIGVYDNNTDAAAWTLKLNKATTHTLEDGTVHELTYIPEQEPTCEVAGHSSGLFCEACNEYLAGNHDWGMAADHIDDDMDGYCDWCDEKLTEDDDVVVECDHACHKGGMSGFFWLITNFFNKLFRLNSVCSCGEPHYEL